ncbi:MAG TPA: S-layer homology domain-containing protein, partial [Candidatus Eremiobacteraceae bacterium]|nr:S-layer homology domain-containing protein [Candidatus Eremiobacteraceae bacterium]
DDSGAFAPNDSITRGEFARWLVMANNAIWAADPGKQIQPSQATISAYPDVPTTHADYPYIQGLHDAGFSVGFDDQTFRPDAPLTREQMIAMKEAVDHGGVDPFFVQSWDSTMPGWTDRDEIDPQFRGAVAEDSAFDARFPEFAVQNVLRTWGIADTFRPKAQVTRAEAALCLWKIGSHVETTNEGDEPRSAEDVLAAQPSPSST